jgi:hypothetical protein
MNIDPLARELTTLAQVEAPRDLAPAVLARVARLDVVHPRTVAPAGAGTAWGMGLGALGAALVVVAVPVGERAWYSAAAALPDSVAGAVGVSVGLALYLTGLLVSARAGTRPRAGFDT